MRLPNYVSGRGFSDFLSSRIIPQQRTVVTRFGVIEVSGAPVTGISKARPRAKVNLPGLVYDQLALFGFWWNPSDYSIALEDCTADELTHRGTIE